MEAALEVLPAGGRSRRNRKWPNEMKARVVAATLLPPPSEPAKRLFLRLRAIRDARLTAETWHQFLDDFVIDPELVQRFKAQPPR